MEEKRVSKRTNKGSWKYVVQENRRKAAEARQVEYDKLTLQQKLAKLDKFGHTATKERAKIAAKLKTS